MKSNSSKVEKDHSIDEAADSDSHHPVTCFICVDNYTMNKKPLILVCGHTFCEVCLQNMFDNCNEILRRLIFQVNKSLPQNYDFEFVVEEISNINDKGIKTRQKFT